MTDHDPDLVRAHLAAILDANLWALAAKDATTPERQTQLLAQPQSTDYPSQYLILALARLVVDAYYQDPDKVTYEQFLDGESHAVYKTIDRLKPMLQPFDPDAELNSLDPGGESKS
jgi:hypothetical protein